LSPQQYTQKFLFYAGIPEGYRRGVGLYWLGNGVFWRMFGLCYSAAVRKVLGLWGSSAVDVDAVFTLFY
jgi:hypothetical protein